MRFLVATVTPLDSRGRVDLARLRAHILWLSLQGVDGFIPTGTSGEFLYLTDREREAVHRTVLDTARDKVVYPCTWDPSPTTTRYLTDAAREQGATGILMPPPLYYSVPDPVVEAWYRQVHDMTELPILAYHNPGHLQTPINSDLYSRLRADGVIAGLTDASGDAFRLRRLCGQDPGAVYAGGDRLLGEVAQIDGCAGFVSMIGNAWPTFAKRILQGEPDLDEALTDRLNRLRRAGGFRAIKSLLRMGCRSPLIAPPRELIDTLPAAELA